jgi:hypothetical protein
LKKPSKVNARGARMRALVIAVALLVALVLATVAPPDAAAAPMTAGPTVKITTPAEGSVISGTDVTITLDVGDIKLVPGSEATQKSDLHVHYLLDVDPTPWLDGKHDIPTGDPNIVHSGATSYTFKNLKPGAHRVTVILTNADHLAIQPPVAPSVSFTVKLGLTITAPVVGAVVKGPDLTVTLDIGNLKLVPGAQATQKSDLHVHYLLDVDPTPWLDGKHDIPAGDPNIIHSAATSYTFKNVKPGPHRLTVILTNADHIAIQPPVAPSVTFTVSVALDWRARAAMPESRYGLGVAVGPNGRIYAIGGYNGTNELATVEEFDPAANAWAAKAKMPTARSALGVVTARNGKIYAIGGFDSTSRLSTVEEYDPATNTWAARASMPTPRSALGVAAASNGKIYAIGGCKGNLCEQTGTVEEYDPATNTWAAKANMPTARSALGVAAASNGKVYAVGGCQGSLCERVGTVEEYDPATNTWAAKAKMPTPRGSFGIAASSDGKVYVVGGTDGRDRFARVEVYDPAIDTWIAGADMPSTRSDLALATLGGKVYAIGGYGGGSGTVEEATIGGAQPETLAVPTATAPRPTGTVPSQTTTAVPTQSPVPATPQAAAGSVAVVPPPAVVAPSPSAVPPTPAPGVTKTTAESPGTEPASAPLPVATIAVVAALLVGTAGLTFALTRGRRQTPHAAAVAEQPPVPSSAAGNAPSEPRASSWPPTGVPPSSSFPLGQPAPGSISPMANLGSMQPSPSQSPVYRTPTPGLGSGTPPPSGPAAIDQATVPMQFRSGPDGAVTLPPGLQLVSSEPKSGGMAAVYKAYQPSLDRFVALKVIHPNLATDPALLQRFYEEARRTAKLVHPNIVTIYDTGQLANGSLYITMRYIDGVTLQELVARERWLALARAVSITVSVGEALDYAHQQGVIHRDVKPSNVLVEASDRVTLTDFGIATLWGDAGVTRAGSIVGTPRYMSPEQALGQPADHRSDIYSLAIVLYEMLAGRPPFQAETPTAILHAHVSLPPRPPQDLNPEISPALGAAILKALSKDPAQRQQSAHDFIREIRAAASAPKRD